MTSGLTLPLIILVAALVAVPAAIARHQWVLAVGFLAGGAGVSLQVPKAYGALDPLLGGVNLTNLLYHLLTLVGIAAFVVLVWTANPSRDRVWAFRVVALLTAVICVLDVILFAIGSAAAQWGEVDLHLTARVATPLFLVYAAPLWVELGGLAVASIVTEQAQTRGRGWSVARAGMTLVITGSAVALVWVGNAVLVAVTAVVVGHPPRAEPVGPVLALTAATAVFSGLALTNLPHLLQWVQQIRLDMATRALWRRAAAVAPEVTLSARNRLSIGSRATLYRRWVEIEDAMRLGRLQLSRPEQEHVVAMQHLFKVSATGSTLPVRGQ